ncbi:MAG: hypothetical protein J5I93_18335 [Pirellulaceae bacterium]|nr:hypothetical protein [Pirellulaceae bacterium]
MKKLGLFAILVLFVLGLSARPALALPVFDKFFKKHYVEGKGNAALEESVKEAKCNVCHYGTSKKNRNDYGMALSDLLDKDNYKTARVNEEPDVVDKELKEAFEKVEKMKSTGGAVFGELIKAGKVPGTAPAE